MGNDEMTEYLIWLQGAMGAGSLRAIEALNYFGNAENIYKASHKERAASKIFTANELKRLNSFKLDSVKDIIADCLKLKIVIIPIGSKKYPLCLSQIENPPLVIYVKGEMPDFDNNPVICVVGPRKVSEYGKKASYSLSYRLARSGMIVVSGGAVGTDYYAHLGALKSGGKTVLIMGCGIECGYLPVNEPLRRHVSQNGCIISEYPPLIKPTRFSFPIRNRLMAALSSGTVVIEAGKKSGALITASCTLEQGKEVFVIPGSPTAEEYVGSNLLLRDGARPILDVSDIFNEYIPRFPDKIDVKRAYEKPLKYEKKSEAKKEIKKNLVKTLSNEAKIVYNQLDKHKFYPDEICCDNLGGGDILSALTELEIEGVIRALPGGLYEVID